MHGRRRQRRVRGLTRCTTSPPAAHPLPPPQPSLTRSVYHHFRPADVIKVMLQMQLAGQRGNLAGMGTIFTHMIEKEGPRSLYLGIAPALTRSVVYGGLRLGLYEPCKHVCSYAFGSTNFAFKLASGIIAGALATTLTNPMEVLKVRLQMSTSSTSTIGEVRKVIAQEGLKALWKGVGPAMARAGCLTASQLATYDETKQDYIC